MSTAVPGLRRRLGLPAAVAIGLGSMLGAGVFVVFAPATAAAGGAAGVVLALALASWVALCNALSSALLAGRFPVSGGSYHYGRQVLGPWWGFFAGWCFIIGKLASCAAMALVLAAYLMPPEWQRPFAVAVVLVLTAVNAAGITRTALVAAVLLLVTLSGLALLIAFGWLEGPGWAGLVEVFGVVGIDAPDAAPLIPAPEDARAATHGVLQAAGLIFFAFAGYARIATLGEEVRRPRWTIGRAIPLALAAALGIYLVVLLSLLGGLGTQRLAQSTAPVLELAETAGPGWLGPVAQFAAAAACGGALLGLIAGIARTGLAMARDGELPRGLAAVHPRHQVPHRATWLAGLIVAALTTVLDPVTAIAVSGFGVLLYYFITNLSAFRLDGVSEFSRIIALCGGLGCAVLVLSLPAAAMVGGAGLVLSGMLWRLLRWRLQGRPQAL